MSLFVWAVAGCGASQSGTYVEDNFGLDDGDLPAPSPPPPPPVNQAPQVAPFTNISLALPIDATSITGVASDSDGTIVTYSWSQTGGPGAATFSGQTTATVIVSNLSLGTYTFRLTVTDDDGLMGNATVRVTVSQPPANSPPVAVAGADQAIVLPTNSVNLVGSGTDPDGTIASYLWSQVSGPSMASLVNATTGTLTASGLMAGTYVFRLTVTDNGGATGSDQATVVVNNPPANQPPVANAGADMVIVLPTSMVTLNGSGTDADGTIASYEWGQMSGPSSALFTSPTSADAGASLLQAGRYVFRLTVTDNGGATGTDDVIVDVNDVALMSPNFAAVSAGLLAPKCVSCHGADKPKGMYDLSSYTGAMKNVIVNNATGSKLYTVIAAPAGHKGIPITPEEKNLLRDWINQGATN